MGRNLKALKAYQELRKRAKEIGGAYEQYVKEFYKEHKTLAWKVGRKERKPEVLTYETYLRHISAGETNASLIKGQYGIIDDENAYNIMNALDEEGITISFDRAKRRDLTAYE